MSLTPLRKQRSIVDLAVGWPKYSTTLFRSTEREALEVVGRVELAEIGVEEADVFEALGVAGVELAHEASVPIKMSEDKTKKFLFMAFFLSKRDKDSRLFFSIEGKRREQKPTFCTWTDSSLWIEDIRLGTSNSVKMARGGGLSLLSGRHSLPLLRELSHGFALGRGSAGSDAGPICTNWRHFALSICTEEETRTFNIGAELNQAGIQLASLFSRSGASAPSGKATGKI